ncbi:uncharacterized protein LOC143963072 isoform X2 [Lithobates pipiens]
MDSTFPVLTAGIVVPLCAGAAWAFYRYRNQSQCKWTIDEKTQQALRRYVLMESTHGKPYSVLQTFREYARKNSIVKRMLFTPDQDGKVYAVEEEDSMAESAEEMILVSGFKNNQFKLLCQHPVDAIHTLHSKFDLEKVDLVLMDFQSDGYLEGLKSLTELGLLSPGSLILLNNMGPLVGKDFVGHLDKSVHYRVVNGCQSLLKVEYGQSSQK